RGDIGGGGEVPEADGFWPWLQPDRPAEDGNRSLGLEEQDPFWPWAEAAGRTEGLAELPLAEGPGFRVRVAGPTTGGNDIIWGRVLGALFAAIAVSEEESAEG